MHDKSGDKEFYASMNTPRFTGITTFLRTPSMVIENINQLDIAIIGVHS